MESLLSRSKGRWKGVKKLWLAPGKSCRECDITARVGESALGRSAVIDYEWTLEGERQQGHLMLNPDYGKGAVQAAWIDSFHMATGIMILKGEFTEHDTIDLIGSYPAPPGPDWRWRMIISASDNKLTLINYNVSPGGDEHLAIEVSLTHLDS
ncbi:DUF1579 family protein [bacterium]|nr:DUF1579 family protein [candidate division CSSED10-310 bacterium]